MIKIKFLDLTIKFIGITKVVDCQVIDLKVSVGSLVNVLEIDNLTVTGS